MNNLIAQKNALIEKIREDWQKTPEEYRYYSKENIQQCDLDLENFIQNLNHLDKKSDIQSQIAQEIRQICEKLSTFDNPEEADNPEYSYGFLYSHLTDEMSEFIIKSAVAFGFCSPKIEPIKPLEFYLISNDWSPFRVAMGASEENGIVLEYNAKKHCFYFDETPFYDPTFLPMFNVSLNEKGTEFSFEVLQSGEYKKYILSAQNQSDALWFHLIFDLHHQKIVLDEKPKNFADITLDIRNEMIYRFENTNYNENGDMITMYNEGAGAKVFVWGINEKGEMQSPNVVSDLKIVDEKFFVVHAVPDWKRFEVQSVDFQGDELVVVTKNQMITYDEERTKIISDCTPQIYHYPIKTYPFLLDFIQKVIALKKEFVSGYQK